MTNKDQIKKLKGVESQINKHLYFICSIITIVTMAVMLTEFLSRGAFAPANMGLFYLGVLLIYSLHKELVRWLGQRKVERQGEHFVYAWIVLTALLYVVNFFSNGYFSHSATGEPLEVLKDLSILTVEVLAIFIFTRCLKILKIVAIRPKK